MCSYLLVKRINQSDRLQILFDENVCACEIIELRTATEKYTESLKELASQTQLACQLSTKVKDIEGTMETELASREAKVQEISYQLKEAQDLYFRGKRELEDSKLVIKRLQEIHEEDDQVKKELDETISRLKQDLECQLTANVQNERLVEETKKRITDLEAQLKAAAASNGPPTPRELSPQSKVNNRRTEILLRAELENLRLTTGRELKVAQLTIADLREQLAMAKNRIKEDQEEYHQRAKKVKSTPVMNSSQSTTSLETPGTPTTSIAVRIRDAISSSVVKPIQKKVAQAGIFSPSVSGMEGEPFGDVM